MAIAHTGGHDRAVARAAGARWWTIGATEFSGCDGAFGNLCDGKFHYAELGTARRTDGRATGHGWLARLFGMSGELPAGAGIWIRYGNRTTYATKLDRGYGQGGDGVTSDSHYAVDLHDDLARWLRFPGKGDIQVSPNFSVPTGSRGPAPRPGRPAYANPLAHARVTPERIDQGVDYAGSGYLTAIADGVVTESVPNGSGWEGEAYLEYKITQPGELNGVFIYYAEGVNPVVSKGEQVRAGARVADLRSPMPHGVELGFAAGANQESYYRYHDGAYREGTSTRPGIAFSNLIRRLGGPGGRVEPEVVGRFPEYMPTGEPSGNISATAVVGTGGSVAVGEFIPAGDAAAYTWPGGYYSAVVQLQRGIGQGAHHSNSAWEYVKGKEFVKEIGK